MGWRSGNGVEEMCAGSIIGAKYSKWCIDLDARRTKSKYGNFGLSGYQLTLVLQKTPFRLLLLNLKKTVIKDTVPSSFN